MLENPVNKVKENHFINIQTTTLYKCVWTQATTLGLDERHRNLRLYTLL